MRRVSYWMQLGLLTALTSIALQTSLVSTASHDDTDTCPSRNEALETVLDLSRKWQDTTEGHDAMKKLFLGKVVSTPFLRNHRAYFHRRLNDLPTSYGENGLPYLWQLLVGLMPSEYKVLEIGVYKGQTTILNTLLAGQLGKKASVYGLTPLDSSDGHPTLDYKGFIRKHYAEWGLDMEVDLNLLHGLSTDAKMIDAARASAPYDILYIDGGHTYDVVKSDIDHFLPMLKEGGILVIDDCACGLKMSNFRFPGIDDVCRAVDAVLPPLSSDPLPYVHLFSTYHNRIWGKLPTSSNAHNVADGRDKAIDVWQNAFNKLKLATSPQQAPCPAQRAVETLRSMARGLPMIHKDDIDAHRVDVDGGGGGGGGDEDGSVMYVAVCVPGNTWWGYRWLSSARVRGWDPLLVGNVTHVISRESQLAIVANTLQTFPPSALVVSTHTSDVVVLRDMYALLDSWEELGKPDAIVAAQPSSNMASLSGVFGRAGAVRHLLLSTLEYATSDAAADEWVNKALSKDRNMAKIDVSGRLFATSEAAGGHALGLGEDGNMVSSLQEDGHAIVTRPTFLHSPNNNAPNANTALPFGTAVEAQLDYGLTFASPEPGAVVAAHSTVVIAVEMTPFDFADNHLEFSEIHIFKGYDLFFQTWEYRLRLSVAGAGNYRIVAYARDLVADQEIVAATTEFTVV